MDFPEEECEKILALYEDDRRHSDYLKTGGINSTSSSLGPSVGARSSWGKPKKKNKRKCTKKKMKNGSSGFQQAWEPEEGDGINRYDDINWAINNNINNGVHASQGSGTAGSSIGVKKSGGKKKKKKGAFGLPHSSTVRIPKLGARKRKRGAAKKNDDEAGWGVVTQAYIDRLWRRTAIIISWLSPLLSGASSLDDGANSNSKFPASLELKIFVLYEI